MTLAFSLELWPAIYITTVHTLIHTWQYDWRLVVSFIELVRKSDGFLASVVVVF